MSENETEKTITIEEWELREQKMSEKAKIPQKYEDMLQNVLEQMEAETGNMYQFTVNTFGIHPQYNTIIGNFNRDYKIQVCNMKKGYEELEGIYNNKSEVYKRVRMLRAMEYYYDFKEYTDKYGKTYTIGKCKICNSYNENVPNRSPNNIDNSCCQNDQCSKKVRFSKWDNIELDHHTDKIWDNGGGGGIFECHELGKWKMIKN